MCLLWHPFELHFVEKVGKLVNNVFVTGNALTSGKHYCYLILAPKPFKVPNFSNNNYSSSIMPTVY